MSKKIQNILSLIEIAESNLSNARVLLSQFLDEKKIVGVSEVPEMGSNATQFSHLRKPSYDDANSIEIVEGYFDGENMLGDNGKTYTVPQNYASKSQLVMGDRMKWSLTPDKEVFKLIGQAERERVVGQFSMEGENYIVVTDKHPEPIKILKASATFAMKNMGLEFGDEVVLVVPKNVTPRWGAFSSVVKSLSEQERRQINAESEMQSGTVLGSREEDPAPSNDTDYDDIVAAKEAKKDMNIGDDGLEFDYI